MTAAPRGEKQAAVAAAVERTTAPFSTAELQQACPGVSIDMIRRVLKDLRAAGKVKCLGRGRNALWQKVPD